MFTDNRVKPFFQKDGKKFNLRIINKESTMRDNPRVIEMLNRLATESEIDLDKNLRQKGEHLKILHEPHQLWQISDEWLANSFENESNRQVLVVENEIGEPVSCTIALINCPHYRKVNRVPEEVGTYVYVTHVISREDHKNYGMFSRTLDKLMTMLSNPKRDLPTPIEYSISVSAAEAIKEDTGEEMTYIMNLPRYTRMFQNRFEDNKLQVRFQSLESAKLQEGRDRLPVEPFLNEAGDLDEKKVSNLVEERKPEAASEGKWVRGLFLEGRQTKNHAEAVEFRRNSAPKLR